MRHSETMIREWQALIIVARAGHQVWKSVRNCLCI